MCFVVCFLVWAHWGEEGLSFSWTHKDIVEYHEIETKRETGVEIDIVTPIVIRLGEADT